MGAAPPAERFDGKRDVKVKAKALLEPLAALAADKYDGLASCNSAFARALGSVDFLTRNRGVQALTRLLQRKTDITEADMTKLWKGLYFCFWHSDKPTVQAELAEQLASILGCVSDHVAYLYFTIFFQTMRREWFSIDHLRINKFLLLVRKFVGALFIRLQANDWELPLVTRYTDFLQTQVMLPHASDHNRATGLAYHLADVYIPELRAALAAAESDAVPALPPAIARQLLQPFVAALQQGREDALIHRVMSSVFDLLVAEARGDDVSELDSSAASSNGILSGSVSLSEFAATLFDLGATSALGARNRAALYEVSQSLVKAQRKRAKRESASGQDGTTGTTVQPATAATATATEGVTATVLPRVTSTCTAATDTAATADVVVVVVEQQQAHALEASPTGKRTRGTRTVAKATDMAGETATDMAGEEAADMAGVTATDMAGEKAAVTPRKHLKACGTVPVALAAQRRHVTRSALKSAQRAVVSTDAIAAISHQPAALAHNTRSSMPTASDAAQQLAGNGKDSEHHNGHLQPHVAIQKSSDGGAGSLLKADGGDVCGVTAPARGVSAVSSGPTTAQLARKKSVSIKLNNNLYFEFGGPVPDSMVRTPPSARSEGGILKTKGERLLMDDPAIRQVPLSGSPSVPPNTTRRVPPTTTRRVLPNTTRHVPPTTTDNQQPYREQHFHEQQPMQQLKRPMRHVVTPNSVPRVRAADLLR